MTSASLPGAGTREPAANAIEWLELFFDLVVVAAMAVLTDGLREEPTLGGVGLFVLLYVGIWFSWISVVLYANVAGERTRIQTVVIAMFLVAIMAATAPIHFESRANAFAIAFLVLRSVTARAAMSTGRVLVSWPLLQFGGAITPWVVGLFLDTPWKYALWALGLGLDLGAVLLRGSFVDDAQLSRLRARFAGRRGRTGGKSRREDAPASLDVVEVEPEHLQVRLGTLVIIVLGEAVAQLVLIAASSEWTRDFIHVAVPGFLLLVGLWWLTFSYGYGGAPNARMALLQPRFGLPMHLLSTIGIVAVAAGLGEMAARAGDHELASGPRWIMCVGLALHFLVATISGVIGGAPRRWVLGWALPCTLAPIVAALAGADLSNRVELWLFVACVVWLSSYGRVEGRRRAAAARASG